MPPKPSSSGAVGEELQLAVQQLNDRLSQEIQQTNSRLEQQQQANSRIEQPQLDNTHKIGELKALLEQLLVQRGTGTSSNDHNSNGSGRPPLVRNPHFHSDSSGGDDPRNNTRIGEQRFHLPKTEFPPFDGFNPTGWRSKCENYFSIFQIPETVKTQMATLHFTGEAQEWYDCFKEECPDLPWALLVEEVLDRFMTQNDSHPVGDFKRVYHTGKVTDYIRQFERAKSRLMSETKIRSTTLFVQGFIEGLKEEIRYAVESHDPVTLNQAFHYARMAELNLEGIDRRNRTLNKYIPYQPPKLSKETDPPVKREPIAQPIPKLGTLPATQEMSREQMRALKLCYYCKEKYFPGHKCKTKTLLALQAQETASSGFTNIESEDDHPQYIEWVTDVNMEESLPQEHAVITMCADPEPQQFHTLRFKGVFDQIPICILIDTGSTHSFINPSLVDTSKWAVASTTPLHVRIANGAAMATSTKCDNLPFTLQGQELTGAVRLLSVQGYDLILGMDWLSLHGPMTIDWQSGQVHLHKGDKQLTFKVQTEVAEVHLCSEVLCPTTESKKGNLLMIAHISSMSEETHKSVPVPTLLQQVLDKFSHVFQQPSGLPPQRAIDHRIPLIDSTKTVSIRPYRYSYFQKMEIDKIIEELINNAFIRPSTSPYSSPVLLVKKKDDSWRLCIDYRQLNDNTVKNKYPIPIIDDLLDELRGAHYFSKVDLRSGYHQIRMHEDDIYKTAFKTHNGHFEFVVMPFGLTNAPATFQTLMNNLFKPFIRKFILVFFDDILIYSASLTDHIQHVTTTLEVLAANNLFAKQSKCEFGLSQIEYLGHIISSEGVSTDPQKVQSMLNWPVPQNVKELRGFLGLTGYYRKFVKNYGLISKPLTDLTKKNAFGWNPQAQLAFEKLKSAMFTAPVLTLPDFSQQFTIETDASALGMGAVLMQNQKPIAYFSKSLGVRNQGLSTYEKELLALLSAVKKWRHYLVGAPFVIKTDQISLKHLLEQRVSTTLQHKSLCTLLGLNYVIEYKKGKENKVADALSRVEGHNWAMQQVSAENWAVSEILPQWIQELLHSYEGDPWIADLKLKLATTSGSPPSDLTLHQGVLRYKGRICVGATGTWRDSIIQALHDSAIGGHSGINVTYHKVKKLFYWPSLKQSIHDYVSSCHKCQLNKGENVLYPGLLQPLPIPDGAWQSVGLDFITGLPRSRGKDVILVVIDRLTKYGHFIPLTHPFTAATIAQVFLDNVYKLHGLPQNLVSDRDPLFTSAFWRELMTKIGVQLNLSTAYHPQSDGQTERLNQCLEQYLRCMIFDQQKTWCRWLSLAEYWYNTSFQQSLGTSPFQALYGYQPTLLPLGDTIRSTNASVNDLLKDRHKALIQIRSNLVKAQNRMKKYADLKRSDRHFKVGDWVYLRVQPYKQLTLTSGGNQKLNAKYCGPFEVLEKVGQLAYKLNLPPDSHIHPVIHVSQLKQHIGRKHITSPFLPWLGSDGTLRVAPERIVARRLIQRHNEGVPQVKVKWAHSPEDDASWEDYAKMKLHYPSFILGVENSLKEGEILLVSAETVTEAAAATTTGAANTTPISTILIVLGKGNGSFFSIHNSHGIISCALHVLKRVKDINGNNVDLSSNSGKVLLMLILFLNDLNLCLIGRDNISVPEMVVSRVEPCT
ncbi:hypothetical protein LUZ61_006977 [Rhynchospora tenuis]|uniref:Reverse transcriptase n=1 Tax=Rhynchospora tenuis TaxID=198213 RepID=A0AAD6EW02_9POAL|nr:hypothetical protein LUZ61_006977 [Rhynchospora tenuis]